MKARKTALIIGCGKMGCFFDSPGSADISTHAHALSKLGYELSFYDQSSESAQKAAQLWSGEVVELFTNKKYDVGVLSISTVAHYETLSKLPAENFETLVVEKPFCETKELAQEIFKKFNQKTIFINYSRLYLKEYQALKLKIEKGLFGECSRFVGQYSRGMLNNGSHLISLLKFLLNLSDMKVIVNNQSIERVSGFTNYDVYLKNDNLSGSVIGIDDSNFSFWECTLFFEKAVIKISDFGQTVEVYAHSHGQPVTLSENIRINYNDALMNLYKKVEEKDATFALETNGNALYVHEIMKNILGEK